MRKCIFLFLILVSIMTAAAVSPLFAAQTAGKERPIVLVHGFMGFGEDEMLGYNYWGGFTSLREDLEDQGFTVYVAAVGPVSSSWDRACELFAQIRGGAVDYGNGHSDHFGHAPSDSLKVYDGFYPEWDADHPVHLVGHSQGGQTIRLLAQLMSQGHPTAQQVGYDADGETSLLFQGGHSEWVTSVTTISTPHDGTTLARGLDLIPFVQEFILGIAATIGLFTDDVVYDFKLGQWGLVRNPGESLADYFDKVTNSAAFNGTTDASAYDMDPTDGVYEFNGWVAAQPDIYYFSLSTEQSYEMFFTGFHGPELGMNLALHPATYFMGCYTTDGIDSDWFENDGVVNTVSMDGPKLGGSDIIRDGTGNPQPGVWNHLGVESLDHGDIIGILPYSWEVPSGYDSLADWYIDLADRLTSLE